MKFTIALLQISPSGSDQDVNLEKGLECCRQAKALGGDLAVFPELWNIGFAPIPYDAEGQQRWVNSAIHSNGNFFRTFADLAREIKLNIAITYLEAHKPRPRNTVSIIDRRGAIVLNYSKAFICDFGKEQLLAPHAHRGNIGCDVLCSAGNSFDVCNLSNADGDIRVGAMICADREFPEPATELMRNGAELIIVPNSCEWDDIRTAVLKTRAFENLVAIAMVNYPEPLNNGQSSAYTCIPWRNGRPADMQIAHAGEHEQIVLATVDMDEIREFRRKEAWKMKYRLSRTRNSGLSFR